MLEKALWSVKRVEAPSDTHVEASQGLRGHVPLRKPPHALIAKIPFLRGGGWKKEDYL